MSVEVKEITDNIEKTLSLAEDVDDDAERFDPSTDSAEIHVPTMLAVLSQHLTNQAMIMEILGEIESNTRMRRRT